MPGLEPGSSALQAAALNHLGYTRIAAARYLTPLPYSASNGGNQSGETDGVRNGSRTRNLLLGREPRYQLRHTHRVGDSGALGSQGECYERFSGEDTLSPVPTGLLSRGVALPIERADDGDRTRDLHLGKVTRYQLRYIRIRDPFPNRWIYHITS